MLGICLGKDSKNMRKQGTKFFTQVANLVLLSAISLAKTVSVNAEPAPIFKPILRDIENQLPKSRHIKLLFLFLTRENEFLKL